jgi:3',5'-cyclic AMP phosphodiesterase CpdA
MEPCGVQEPHDLLVQMSDTHIEAPGKLLYGKVDTAVHLQESVREINAMQPQPDLVMVTGDLVETPSEVSYAHFSSLLMPLRVPVFLMPGNHDDPQLMLELYGDTPMFPAIHSTLQYAIDDFPVRILALNSHFQGSELPDFGTDRLQWLQQTLAESERPTLIAIHHPPMKTGIGFIDMVGAQWYTGIRDVIAQHASAPGDRGPRPHRPHRPYRRRAVYMAGSTAHQLIAARVHDRGTGLR